MITGSEEYQAFLASIADTYIPPNISIRIPTDEPVYNIDLNTRTVEAPSFLGVEADHEAELIYFQMDRFFDQIDLASCICIVQFKNAKQEEYYYIVPYFDTDSIRGKIIFAWDIQSPVTKYSGTVNFSFKFFKVNRVTGELIYELNTLVARSRVLVGWATKLGADHTYNQLSLNDVLLNEDLMDKIQYLLSLVDVENNRLQLYWIDV